MSIQTVLYRVLLLALLLVAAPASAQEHPARRVANIVSVAVEEYKKLRGAAGRVALKRPARRARTR